MATPAAGSCLDDGGPGWRGTGGARARRSGRERMVAAEDERKFFFFEGLPHLFSKLCAGGGYLRKKFQARIGNLVSFWLRNVKIANVCNLMTKLAKMICEPGEANR